MIHVSSCITFFLFGTSRSPTMKVFKSTEDHPWIHWISSVGEDCPFLSVLPPATAFCSRSLSVFALLVLSFVAASAVARLSDVVCLPNSLGFSANAPISQEADSKGAICATKRSQLRVSRWDLSTPVAGACSCPPMPCVVALDAPVSGPLDLSKPSDGACFCLPLPCVFAHEIPTCSLVHVQGFANALDGVCSCHPLPCAVSPKIASSSSVKLQLPHGEHGTCSQSWCRLCLQLPTHQPQLFETGPTLIGGELDCIPNRF